MSGQRAKKGVVVVISGPSGVGKSTICHEVVRRMNDAFLSVSATTRAKAATETDGKDYWYLSRDEFQKRIEQGMFLEYAEVFGNFYGTPRDKVDEAIAAGNTVILEIDVQGGKQVKAEYPDAVMIFILAPTQKEIAERLHGRGREDKEAAERRLAAASHETAVAWQYYDHMVINDDLENAVEEVTGIINAARGQSGRARPRTKGKLERK